MAEIEYPWKEIFVEWQGPVDPEFIELIEFEQRRWNERMKRNWETRLFEEKPHGRDG